MKTRKNEKAVAAALAVAIVLAACGGDDDDSGGEITDEATAETTDEATAETSQGGTEESTEESTEEPTGEEAQELPPRRDGACSASSATGDNGVPTTTTTSTSTATTGGSWVPDPAWAVSPSLVRNSGIWLCEYAQGMVIGASTEGVCEYEPYVISILVPEGSTMSELIREAEPPLSRVSIEPDEPKLELQAPGFSVHYYDVSDRSVSILELSQQLWQSGLFASPNYRMYPAPGRIYFPGTLPVVGDAAEVAITDEVADSVVINVFDTATPGDPDSLLNGRLRTIGAHERGLPTSSQDVTDGHGLFVSGVIAQHTSAQVNNYSISASHQVVDDNGTTDPTDDVVIVEQGEMYYEHAFLRATLDQQQQIDGDEEHAGGELVPTINNLSAGFQVCAHGHVDGEAVKAMPVSSWAAVRELLTTAVGSEAAPANALLVAAAGNSDRDDIVTFPAAFAAHPSLWDDSGNATSFVRAFENGAYDVPLDFADQVVAVGALEGGTPEQPYSTTGAWVTGYAEGCHHSLMYPSLAPRRYPEVADGAITYPAIEVAFSAVRDDGLAIAYWCGSSFATALTTASIANELLGAATIEALTEALGTGGRLGLSATPS